MEVGIHDPVENIQNEEGDGEEDTRDLINFRDAVGIIPRRRSCPLSLSSKLFISHNTAEELAETGSFPPLRLRLLGLHGSGWGFAYFHH